MVAQQEEYVKLHISLDAKKEGIAGENLWAKDLHDGTYEIYNIPFFTDSISIHDIVRVENQDGMLEIIEVVEKKTESFAISYPVVNDKELLKDNFASLCQWARDNDCHIEGAIAGHACIAIPVEVLNQLARSNDNFDTAKEIISKMSKDTGIDIDLYVNEDSPD